MKYNALRQYIRMFLENRDAHVPDQLMSEPGESSKENKSKNKEKDETDEISEFCSAGAGGVMGFSAPLGMNKRKNRRSFLDSSRRCL